MVAISDRPRRDAVRRARSALFVSLALAAAGCGSDDDERDAAASAAASSSVAAGVGGAGAGGASASSSSSAATGGDGGSAGSTRGAGGGGGADVGAGGSGGSGGVVCSGDSSPYATSVVSHQFGPGQDFGQADFPGNVLGPPHGGGAQGGSLDVASLGNGGTVVLAFTDNAIIDGPGPDLLVFENAFGFGPNPEDVFAELGTVAVSDDGVTWTEFPCTATAPPFGACAGWHPVYANPDENTIDPTDPAVAGGDPFDLAAVGVSQARFVRITDRVDLPDVFDLDAIAIVNAACR